jgi:4-amino-4-deoxy-L-arabinose transferase-like glycosyltransferase
MSPADGRPVSSGRIELVWVFLTVGIVCVVLAIRLRLLAIPLERDEGEYAYCGQLMLQGIPPYKLAYSLKFPGTPAAYAVIMAIFGQTITAIHLGLLLVNAATVALLFFLGRQLVSRIAGLTAAASYAVLAVSPTVFGFEAHATHFVMLPVLGGMLLLVQEARRESIWKIGSSGLLFGLGLLMKQPAIFFVVSGALGLAAYDFRRRFSLGKMARRNFVFGLGAVVPLAITCLLLWRAGVFGRFLFWTVTYANQYGSLIALSDAPQIFAARTSAVLRTNWPLWLLAAVGLSAGFWNKRLRSRMLVLLGLMAASLLALASGFYFRPHYFILVLPAVALLIGVATSALSDAVASRGKMAMVLPLLLFSAAVSAPILTDRTLFFVASPVEVCRMIYPGAGFPESIQIAHDLRERSKADETIAVLGSEPQIYFYAQRHSATGYIYTYSLMEPQPLARGMQMEMIREIEEAQPKFFVAVKTVQSWLRRPDSERLILTWIRDYTAKYYQGVGLLNFVAPDRSDYYFGNVPPSLSPASEYIAIYERKP